MTTRSSTNGRHHPEEQPQDLEEAICTPVVVANNNNTTSPSTPNKSLVRGNSFTQRNSETDFAEDAEADMPTKMIHDKDMFPIRRSSRVAVWIVSVALVVSVLTGMIAGLLKRNETKGDGSVNSNDSQGPPSFRPWTPQERLDILHEAIAAHDATALVYGPEIPLRADELPRFAHLDPMTLPSVRAAGWSVHLDSQYPSILQEEILERFALALFYFETAGGQQPDEEEQGLAWFHDQGWLDSSRSFCEQYVMLANDDEEDQDEEGSSIATTDAMGRGWYGVRCVSARGQNGDSPRRQRVHQLELSHNGLRGEFPPVLALLEELETLDVGHNALSGSIDGSLFPDSLQFLYASNNQLDGAVPDNLLTGGGHLRTFQLHNNNLDGGFPAAYCPACEGCAPPLYFFSIDCDKVECDCCDVELNCE